MVYNHSRCTGSPLACMLTFLDILIILTGLVRNGLFFVIVWLYHVDLKQSSAVYISETEWKNEKKGKGKKETGKGLGRFFR